MSAWSATAVVLPLPAISMQDKTLPALSFGIVADAHQDVMHDVEMRLETFVRHATDQKTDFIIQLGDFCHPIAENREFMRIWNSYAQPRYHVLGNHDMDLAGKEEAMDYFGMIDKYYSFDFNGVHFVVLDANYLNVDGHYEDYDTANFYVDASQRTWINPRQIEWLEADLKSTTLPTIIFSHQSLANDLWGVKNRTAVQGMLEEINKRPDGATVIACFNGHNHIDFIRQINGIYYIDINSMSYQWLGEKYECTTRYPREVYDSHPMISKVAPYQDPLFGVIRLRDNMLAIEGRTSTWVGPSPESLGLTDQVFGFKYTPAITSRDLEIPFV